MNDTQNAKENDSIRTKKSKTEYKILSIKKGNSKELVIQLCNFETLEVYEYVIGVGRKCKPILKKTPIGIVIQSASDDAKITYKGKRYYIEKMRTTAMKFYQNMVNQGIRFHVYEWNGEVHFDRIALD